MPRKKKDLTVNAHVNPEVAEETVVVQPAPKMSYPETGMLKNKHTGVVCPYAAKDIVAHLAKRGKDINDYEVM